MPTTEAYATMWESEMPLTLPTATTLTAAQCTTRVGSALNFKNKN